jgi:hypothetical protein
VLRRTAFRILRRFCNGRRGRSIRSRTIGFREFGRLRGASKLAHDIEMALTNIHPRRGGWLTMVRRAAVGTSSRCYRLNDCAWPIRPYEPRTYRP